MKKALLLIFPLLLLLNAQLIFSQDDDNFDDLFGGESSSTEEEASGETSDPDDPFADAFSDSDSSDSSSSFDPSIMGPEFKLSFMGEHTVKFQAPVIPTQLNFNGNIKSPKMINDLGVEITYKKLKLVSHWELDLIMNEYGNLESFFRAIPLENYIQWSPWKFKFAVGFQKYVWGTADGLNPTDNLNPLDLSRGNSDDKLSVLSAYMAFYPIDLLSIELIYIPFEQNDNPGYDVSDKVEKVAGVSPTILNTDFDPSSFVLGGKVSLYTRFADISFSYIYNIDKVYSPNITLSNQGVYYSLGDLELDKRRVHNFGVDFKTMVDIFTIWGEFCFTMTEDYFLNRDDIRNHTLDWTIGFDFNYGPDSDFYFNLQYMGQFVPLYDTNYSQEYVDEWNPALGKSLNFNLGEDEEYYEEYYYRTLTNRLGGAYQGLYQGLLLNMDWPVKDELIKPTMKLGYFLPLLYDTNNEKRYGSVLINPEVDFKPMDSFHIIMGARLYFSWHETKGRSVATNYLDRVGQFHDSSCIYFEVSYKWSVDIEK